MSNYVNEVSIYGLMNRLAYINTDTDKLSFYKTKNKKKVVFFEKVDNEADYGQVNYMYLNDRPDSKKATYLEQIVSCINDSYFIDQVNSKSRQQKEILATVRHYSRLDNILVKEIDAADLDAIYEMIERWRYADNGGMKFGWNEHAAVDKFCVSKYIEDAVFRSKTIGLVFYNKSNNECLGYSLIANYVDKDNEVKYLTRKVYNTTGWRNLTEYIDWCTFQEVWKHIGKPNDMLVNWGCSSGGVHWYKTHKWPVHSLEKKWFMTVKNS